MGKESFEPWWTRGFVRHFSSFCHRKYIKVLCWYHVKIGLSFRKVAELSCLSYTPFSLSAKPQHTLASVCDCAARTDITAAVFSFFTTAEKRVIIPEAGFTVLSSPPKRNCRRENKEKREIISESDQSHRSIPVEKNWAVLFPPSVWNVGIPNV